MSDEPKYTIEQFKAAIGSLSAATPQSNMLDQPDEHDSFKAQWLLWLEEYLSPGLL
jgi:hypothetical protein